METIAIAGTSKAGTSMTMRSSKVVKVPHELEKSPDKKRELEAG